MIDLKKKLIFVKFFCYSVISVKKLFYFGQDCVRRLSVLTVIDANNVISQ